MDLAGPRRHTHRMNLQFTGYPEQFSGYPFLFPAGDSPVRTHRAAMHKCRGLHRGIL